MDRRAFYVLLILTLLLTGWLRPAAAQDATPSPSDEHLDLAAMTLTSDDVPAEFSLGIEGYLSGQAFAENFTVDADEASQLHNAGLIVYYFSEYGNGEGGSTIRSYIEQYDSEDGARAGFEILEDESTLASDDARFTDEPLQGVAETPSEITTYSFAAQADSPISHGVDVTFRIDNLIAGVTIDSPGGQAPAKSDAVSLARSLEDRIRAAMSGEELPGINPSLPGRLLRFHSAFPPVLEGYVSAVDGFGAVAIDDVWSGYESGYTRTNALGFGEPPLPVVTDSISAFTSEEGPLAIISGDEFQPPFEQMERVNLDPIEGAEAASGFHFISPLGEGREIDSFRILSVVGNQLVTIDIQAAENEDIAKRLALELTEAQLACIDEGNCELIEEIDTGP
jgi:hypothetical protein